jgi:ABC-type lipoprotein release transport system permease subunit
LAPDGKPIAPLVDNQIVLNEWAAEELGARSGDTIRVDYFEPESSHGQIRQRSATFQLAAIAQLAGAAADRGFTPDVPHVTDQQAMSDWAPPFPFDATRIRPRDEQYWNHYRGTPKAFVALATGRRLWKSRFGQSTSLRIALGRSTPAELEKELAIPPESMGMVFQPVKLQGLAAAAGTTPFDGLFLAFSSFIIAAAVMLVALLFRLGIDGRGAEIGILLAVGWKRRQVTRLFAVEGVWVAAAGSLLGVALGIGYAALLLAALRSWWLGAIGTPFLRLHVTGVSLAIGGASGLLVAVAAIARSVWRVGRVAPRRLLAGETTREDPIVAHPHRGHRLLGAELGLLGLIVAGVVGLSRARLGEEVEAAAFFCTGAITLLVCLLLVGVHLRRGAIGQAVALGRGNLLRLAFRNAARNPGRSNLSIGLIAAACFLIVAVSAFHADPTRQTPELRSGNGGFALVAESDQPIYQDLNRAEGRRELGFSEADRQLLAATTTIALRSKPGDDASCLNLYQPRRPTVLGVPPAMIARGGFAWAASAASSGAEQENPWRLLEKPLPPDPDGVTPIPVAIEKDTAMYALHLWGGVGARYDIPDGRGRMARLRVVGLLSNSLFQGMLLLGEDSFLRLFPEVTGQRFFLIETPPDKTAAVRKVLEPGLREYGFAAETTAGRLAGLLAVQNTYLSTFQSLGGLGLLLGTLGLAAVQLRNALERRRQLALLRAVGFRRSLLAWLVMLESGLLLLGGLALGILAAWIAVLPQLLVGRAAVPWQSLGITLGLVLLAGLTASLAAVRRTLAAPLLPALRTE